MLITRGIKDLQQTPQVISFEFYVDSDMHISLSLSLNTSDGTSSPSQPPFTHKTTTNKQTKKKNKTVLQLVNVDCGRRFGYVRPTHPASAACLRAATIFGTNCGGVGSRIGHTIVPRLAS